MKKLLIGVLAIACCVAFSAPVFAEIRVGGMVSAEQFYWNVSKERLTSGGVQKDVPGQMSLLSNSLNDYSSTEFAMGQPWNRLNVQYISDDKKIGAFIELRTGGQRGGGTGIGGATAGAPTLGGAPAAVGNTNANKASQANPTGEQNFDWELAYIDWHLNPNLYFRVGRQTQTFAIYSPDQQMGHNQGHIVLSGFGNVHGGTSRDAVRAYIKFNDMVRMEIQALNPDSNGTSASPGSLGELSTQRLGFLGSSAINQLGTGGTGQYTMPALVGMNGATPREHNVIPRIDVSIPIKVANFNIEPSFTYNSTRYNDVVPGTATGYTMWGTAIGFMAGFGPIAWSGEYTYGNNLGGGTYVGATNAIPMTMRGANINAGSAGAVNSVTLTDTHSHSAWTQLEYNFGPFALQGIVGFDKSYNEGDKLLAQQYNAGYFNIQRWAYGVQVPFAIAKTFKVVPQFWYYDYGHSAAIGGRASDTNLGSEITAGLFWQLSF
jgi:hypothetical protein